jgi:hypothetical protein
MAAEANLHSTPFTRSRHWERRIQTLRTYSSGSAIRASINLTASRFPERSSARSSARRAKMLKLKMLHRKAFKHQHHATVAKPGVNDHMSDEELREAADARARELGYAPVKETQH